MANSTERLRVCILAKANPFIWVHHYVNAFRRHCDVITAGASLTEADLERMGRGDLAHLVQRHDIDEDIQDLDALLARFPQGWTPDLVVSIQSGLKRIENIDWLACPTAHISVDTWHDFAEFTNALAYDLVFTAQRSFVPLLTAAGNRSVHWLPLACDPDAHRAVACRKEFDVGFVGSLERSLHAERTSRLDLLANRFRVHTANALDAGAMSNAYSRARLGFNSSIAQDVNMRVFEVMAMGVPLFTNRDADVNGLLDLFTDGEHLIAYDDASMIELAEKYLGDTEARERIGNRGQAEVVARHTYDHRVRTLLEVVSQHAPTRPERSVLRGRGRLVDYIPVAPEHVADLGMHSGLSKYALRNVGAKEVTGIAENENQAIDRRQSFDHVIAGDGIDQIAGAFDTVLLCGAPEHVLTREQFMIAHRALRAGGSLVARVSQHNCAGLNGDGSPEHLWQTIESFGFAVLRLELVTARDNDVTAYITARKRTRSLESIAREVYTNNPIPNVSVGELLSRLR